MSDRIPEFDLYAELEVARIASDDVIEAAYRSLVKRYHPDVLAANGGTEGDVDRIKRILVAHDWLADRERRHRYDVAMGIVTPPPIGRRVAGAPPSAPRWDAPDRTDFGANSWAVREYLAELRGLDAARAREVRHAKGIADAAGYAEARRAAFAASRRQRLSEWLFAREAASIIVRTRLGETELTEAVVEPLADVAGAIAVQDILPEPLVVILLVPWTRRFGHTLARPFPPPPVPAPAPTPAAAPFARAGMPPSGPAVSTRWSAPGGATSSQGVHRRVPAIAIASTSLTALIAVAAVAFAMSNQPNRASLVLGATDLPSTQPTAPPTIAPPTAPPVSLPPTLPPGTIDPARVAELQAAAWQTLDDLRAFASYGNLGGARAIVGDTAPGLRVSGLMRATLPNVAPEAIVISGAEGAWTATAGNGTLISSDGTTWTFDWGERPLAVYAKTAEHTLYVLVGSGQRTIAFRVTSLVVTRSTVRVSLTWSFDTSIDAAFYAGDELRVTSLTLGSRTWPVSAPGARIGDNVFKATLRLPLTVNTASSGSIEIAVVDPSGGGSTIVATSLKLVIL